MKISDIYAQYKIMPSLQLHMLRVASVSQIVCESINERVDKENIISACLLHDMGNILKFNIDLYPAFLEPEGKEYWQNIKDEFEKKYGSDEHEATVAICHEIGVGERVIDLVHAFQFATAKENYVSHDFGKKICTYSDMRVEPFSVVTLEERLRDGRVRYKQNKKHQHESDEFFEEMASYLKKIEEQIFGKTNVTPEFITDIKVKEYIEKLISFEVKF